MAARAALVASRPWPLGGQVSSAHRTSTSTRNSVGFVRCCADPAASTSNGSKKKKKEEHVDTRIHWGSSEDGWIGEDEPAASSGQSTSSSGSGSSNGSSGSRRQRRNLNSNASIIDQAPDSHYRWAFVVRSLRLCVGRGAVLCILLNPSTLNCFEFLVIFDGRGLTHRSLHSWEFLGRCSRLWRSPSLRYLKNYYARCMCGKFLLSISM